MKSAVFVNIIRWVARIIGILLIAFFLTFFIGSRLESQNPLDTYNVLVFAVLGIGFAALILSWWKEGLGGIISLLSFIVFNFLAAISPVEGSRYMFILLIPLVPSFLHLLAWRLQRNVIKKEYHKNEL